MMMPMQGLSAIVAIVALALWPPASGAMMLVPLSASTASGMARAAVAAGAVLIGRGPLPGSIIISGDRSRLSHQAGMADVVILAAPSAGCGTTRGNAIA